MKYNDYSHEYRRRINKVQDYIEEHIMDSFTLEDLAMIAGFSKYHFHRIFKAITHESLLQYVNRFKLERAALLLGQRIDMTITDIAYHMGFSDSAVFSRSFKHMYHMSPREYRENYRKNCKDQYHISRYNLGMSDEEKKESIDGHVEIVNIQAIKIAYIRFTGDYQELAIHFPLILERLFEIGNMQNLIEDEAKVVAIYHDHPEFSQPKDFKTSIGITIPYNACIDESELSFMEIPSGLYIVGHFYIPQHLYSVIWDYIYEEWLTTSGYVPRDSFPFEMYMNNYREDKNHMHRVDIYLPVEPLSIHSDENI